MTARQDHRVRFGSRNREAEARLELDRRMREAYRIAASENLESQDLYERETDAGNRLPSQLRWQRELAAALGAPSAEAVSSVVPIASPLTQPLRGPGLGSPM